MGKFKLACEENSFLAEKLENMRKKFAQQKEDNKAGNAKRILAAIGKFPLPIQSGKQAFDLLQGVGEFWANEIEKILKNKPQKRKASPVPQSKRIVYIPEFGSPEWICIMCLSESSIPLAPYDIPYLTSTILSEYGFSNIKNPLQVLEYLTRFELISEDSGLFALTEIGKNLSEKFQSECPTASKFQVEEWDPDSWITENYEESTVETECGPLDFEIVLIVDTAERLEMDFEAIFRRLIQRNLVVERRKLWIGDYQWVCRTKVGKKTVDFALNYIVERKTADDLAHSIVDFRYEEQKIRMRISKAVCIYLLEGKTPQNFTKISANTLINSLISTKFNYGFQIKVTQDSKDTLNWLARFTARIYEEVSCWSSETIASLPTFEEFYEETNPSSGLTVQEIFGKQLRGLDKVGEHSTIAVLKQFPTPLLFYNAITLAANQGKRALSRFFKSIHLENGNVLSKTTQKVLSNLFLGS